MLHSYLQLRARLDRFISSVSASYSEQIVCRAGCQKCCIAGLTIAMVEAVSVGEALGLSPERVFLQAGQPPLRQTGSCSLLNAENMCSIYDARPLICRTQGLPLKYSHMDGVSCCDLNFTGIEPHPSATINMENLDTALFAVNLDFCQRNGLHPQGRVAIDRLAQLAGKIVIAEE